MSEKTGFLIGFLSSTTIIVISLIFSNPFWIEKMKIYKYKDEAYESISKYILTDIHYNIASYLEYAGYEEELDIESLNNYIYQHDTVPFEIKPLKNKNYYLVKKIRKFVKKNPTYKESDLYMQRLIYEVIDTYDVINELHDYYAKNRYEVDDDFNKAKELHKKLILQINSLSEEHEKFNLAYDKEYWTNVEKCLEDYKDEGYLSNYYAYKCLSSADEIRRYMINKGFSAQYDSYIMEFDNAEYFRLCMEFKLAFRNYNRYIEDSESQKNERNFVFVASPQLMDCFQNIDETIVIIPSIMNDYEMYVLNNETAADDLFFNYYDNAVSEYNKIFE